MYELMMLHHGMAMMLVSLAFEAERKTGGPEK